MTAPAPFAFSCADPGPVGQSHVFRTRAGWAGLLMRGPVLCRSFLPVATREQLVESFARSGVAPPPSAVGTDAAPIVEAFVRYYAGEPVDPAAIPVPFDPGAITDFSRRIYEELRQVRRGRTTTYGALAVAAGRPRAARAVGAAMRANRFPLLVPCHRVLAYGGGFGGFSSSGGLNDKRLMLGLEGSAELSAGARSVLRPE